MNTRLAYILLAFGIVGLSTLAYAQSTGTGVLKLPQDIEFKSPLTGPPQTVVLYGDPIPLGRRTLRSPAPHGVTGFENAKGGAAADIIYGTAAANVLDGGDLADALFGFGGKDSLIGGPGNDDLVGGAGKD